MILKVIYALSLFPCVNTRWSSCLLHAKPYEPLRFIDLFCPFPYLLLSSGDFSAKRTIQHHRIKVFFTLYTPVISLPLQLTSIDISRAMSLTVNFNIPMSKHHLLALQTSHAQDAGRWPFLNLIGMPVPKIPLFP